MNIRIFRPVLFVAFCGFTRALFAAEEVPEKNAEPIASFHVPTNGEEIVLPITVGKKKDCLFIMDTGCSTNVIDTSLKSELGFFQGIGFIHTSIDVISVMYYDPPSLQLGSVTLETDDRAVCYDLTEMRKAFGREVLGILGMDSLKHFIVRVDFDKGKLELYPPDTNATVEWGQPFAIHLDYDNGGCPVIAVTLDYVPIGFMVDTGCMRMAIDKDIFRWLYSRRQLGILGKTLSHNVAGQKVEYTACLLNRLPLEPFEHTKVICEQGNGNYLGLPYLSRYVVTFDFPHKTIYLRKGKRYSDIEHGNMSGLYFLREGKGPVVEAVDSDSPGQVAGIHSGDIVVRIDDQEASKIAMFDLRNIFESGDGKKVRLTISRDGKEMEKTLVLKEKTPQWAEAASP